MHDSVHVQVQTVVFFTVWIRSRHVDRLRYGGEPIQFSRLSKRFLFASGRGTHDRLVRLSIFAGDHDGLFFNDRHAHLWIFARKPSELRAPWRLEEPALPRAMRVAWARSNESLTNAGTPMAGYLMYFATFVGFVETSVLFGKSAGSVKNGERASLLRKSGSCGRLGASAQSTAYRCRHPASSTR